MASNSSDTAGLGARLAAVLTWAQWTAIVLVLTGLALERGGRTAIALEFGVGVLVATPFFATAVVAATAGRARARLLLFAVTTLALAGFGVVLAA